MLKNINKLLLRKYLLILISNILIVIFSNFYLVSSEYKDLIELLVLIIISFLIYIYKEKLEYNYILDFLICFILGLIFMFIKDKMIYVYTIFNVDLANNIFFMKSRLSDKFIKKSFQYALIFVITVLEVFINGFIYLTIFD